MASPLFLLAGSPSMQQPKRKLDTVVKLGLFVFVGAFVLIWGGMFLTRPDRSIPPYSIGSQEGSVVAVHVPAWTSDSAITTLIERFRKVGRETRDFGKMKIQPTTPADSASRYARITIYIFTEEGWAEPEVLQQYVGGTSGTEAERELKGRFEKAVRGFYRLTEREEEGRIGPLLDKNDSAQTAAYSRELFKGPVPMAGAGAPFIPAGPETVGLPGPSPSRQPDAPEGRGR
jgi:hypothetical protein